MHEYEYHTPPSPVPVPTPARSRPSPRPGESNHVHDHSGVPLYKKRVSGLLPQCCTALYEYPYLYSKIAIQTLMNGNKMGHASKISSSQSNALHTSTAHPLPQRHPSFASPTSQTRHSTPIQPTWLTYALTRPPRAYAYSRFSTRTSPAGRGTLTA